jgi:disulfide bond formation protein DsbB
MMTTAQKYILVATFGSFALLLGAFAFEYFAGLAPCVLCIWQRWPHALAVLAGLGTYAFGGRLLVLLGAIFAFTSAAIGVFHVGVEQKLWQGLAACSASSMSGASIEDLLNPDVIIAAPIRCDAIAWQLFGVSMAGWNVLISGALGVLWVLAFIHKSRDQTKA